MSVGIIRTGTRVQSASASALTPTLIVTTGRAAGVLIAVISLKSTAVVTTVTAGWTKISQTNGTAVTQAIFMAPIGSLAPVLTWTGAIACQAYMVYLESGRGVLVTNAIGASASANGTTNPHTCPSIDATRTWSIAVNFEAATTANGLQAPVPAGWTPGASHLSTTAGMSASCQTKDFGIGTGAASGAISVTGSVTAHNWISNVIEILLVTPALDDNVPSSVQSVETELAAWLSPGKGITTAEIELSAWLATDGVGVTDTEIVIWAQEVSGATFAETEITLWLGPITIQPNGVRRTLWN